MTSPLTTQVAGTHYKDLGLQPVEFCVVNHYDFCASSIVKYICRHRNKNGRQDVEKALHFASIRMELTMGVSHVERMCCWLRAEVGTARFRKTNGFTIPMERLVEMNKLTGYEADALLALERWLETGDVAHYQDLTTELTMLIADYITEERDSRE